MMKNKIRYIPLLILDLSGIILIATQMKLAGWILFGLGLLSLLPCTLHFRRDFLLIFFSMAMLGLANINTDISFYHVLNMATLLPLAAIIPYCVSRFILKDYHIQFHYCHIKNWYRIGILSIFISAATAYFVFPLYLKDTGSYLNWKIIPETGYLTWFCIWIIVLAIWEELIFRGAFLGLFRRYFPFTIANLTQSILSTSFLYELGFRGWGFALIFMFALIQGYIFKKTESLLSVILIHLTMDIIFFLAIINASYPSLFPLFLK